MGTRHVKLNYEEALDAKKNLLSSELNILRAIKRIKAYRVLRKRELIMKNKLKVTSTALKSKINLMLSTFPDEEGEPRTLKRTRRKRKDEKKDIQEELEGIKEKLAKLQ